MRPLHSLPLLLALALVGCPTATSDPLEDPPDEEPTEEEPTPSTGEPVGAPTDDDQFWFVLTADDGAHQVGANAYTLELDWGDAEPVLGATVTVVPFMTSMGHGSTGDAVVTEVGEGVYDVTNVQFNMPGTWDLTIEVEADGVSDTAVVAVQVVPAD